MDLLGKGVGGLVEVKETVEQYDEPSPLYGFVQYRRRKVVLKYVPEGTSRLLLGMHNSQSRDIKKLSKIFVARMSIHFQAVVEKLTPYDTIFPFTFSAELNDTAFSARCSLHTASASIKSSNDSLRQRGLAEIAEDVCENQVITTNNEDFNKVMASTNSGQRASSRVDVPDYKSSDKENHRSGSSKQSASPAPSSRNPSNVDKALPPTPAEIIQEIENPKTAVNYDEYEVKPSFDGRPSSQSLRPTTRDLQSVQGHKPKVKLGPRPSTDTHGRPTATDPSSRVTDTRPISTLPAGLRMPVRKAAPRPKSPKSQQKQTGPCSTMDSAAPFVSSTPSLPTKTASTKVQPAKTPRRPSAGITGDLSALVQSLPPKSPTMTPEKQRLMKALQLRQKQMAARSLQETHEAEPVPAVLDNPTATKAAHKDSGIRTSVDVFSVDENSNLVHFGTNVFDKETLVNTEASPISVTEASDGPSTQASSVSDEEEATAEQEKAASIINSLDKQTDVKPISTIFQESSVQSSDANSIPSALSIPQVDETLREQPCTPQTVSQPKISQVGVPTVEKDSTDVGPDSVSNSNTPAVPDPKTVSSLPKPTSDDNSQQEMPLPVISEDEDPVLNPLGLSYGERIVLLPFLQQDASSQVARSQVTSHPKDEDEILTNTRHSTGDTTAENRYRRHGLTPSVKRVSETSDENFLSDDSFMEELKYAVVEEAKPISVSKSPITPVFPRTASDQGSEQGRTARSVSNPVQHASREDLLSPNQQIPFSVRSFSIPESQNSGVKPTQILLPTKVGVSSGISQRIKALEKLSSRPPSPSGAQLPSPATSPPFINLRKSSLRSPPAPPDFANYSGHKGRQSVPYPSPSLSPEADSARYRSPPLPPETSGRSGKSRPESISVTATIIRDGRNKAPEVPLNPSEPCPVELYKSPLTVDHQPRENAPRRSLSPLKPPTRKWASNMSISSSSTEHHSDSAKASRRDSFMSRRSAPSRRGSDVELPRSISETSLATLTTDGKREEKKESKKSRLFKRMSNISSASRRSIVQALSPSVTAEPIAEHHEPVYEALQAIVEIGDVNVQFPDTLVGNPSC